MSRSDKPKAGLDVSDLIFGNMSMCLDVTDHDEGRTCCAPVLHSLLATSCCLLFWQGSQVCALCAVFAVCDVCALCSVCIFRAVFALCAVCDPSAVCALCVVCAVSTL